MKQGREHSSSQRPDQAGMASCLPAPYFFAYYYRFSRQAVSSGEVLPF